MLHQYSGNIYYTAHQKQLLIVDSKWRGTQTNNWHVLVEKKPEQPIYPDMLLTRNKNPIIIQKLHNQTITSEAKSTEHG